MAVGRPILLLLLSSAVSSLPTAYHVSTASGSDANPGTQRRPFKTINRCSRELWLQAMKADEELDLRCVIEAGTYRETVVVNSTSASAAPSLRSFSSSDQGRVVISGNDLLSGLNWRRKTVSSPTGCIFVAEVPASAAPFSQLFYDGRMMVEARWPNLDVNDVAGSALDRSVGWRSVENGSEYGSISRRELATHNFSWEGGLATLNVAHQWNTWTRTVEAHRVGSPVFTYPKDLPGLAGYSKPSKTVWGSECKVKCNQFWLSGKLGALDHPGEWFHDADQQLLYFMPPGEKGKGGCSAPNPKKAVEVKARDYAIDVAKGATNIHASGLTLFGATAQLVDCRSCSVSAVDLLYPTYDREVPELNPPGHVRKVAATLINGSDVAITNVSLRYSNNNGIKVGGDGIVVRNVLIHKTDWLGSLTYRPLGAIGNNITVTRATVSWFGNAGVVTSIPNTPPRKSPDAPQAPPHPMPGRFLEVSHTHIHHGGTVGMDTAALYTGGWASAGLRWHHNWVHDASEKCLRGDDQSANMSVHHNVIYNCGMHAGEWDVGSAQAGLGIILKGDGHVVYANTVFAANYSELCLPACRSPLKSFRRQFPLELQNANTQLFNTAAERDLGFPCSCRNKTRDLHHPGGNVTSMYSGADLRLQDAANFDFVPTAGSPLVDAGSAIPPYTNGFVGKAPDIGAYERGGEQWTAGCEGWKECVGGGNDDDATPTAGTSTAVIIDPTTVLARTTTALTSVTIDVCALKLGLDFSDSLLRNLSRHLAPAVLRIGGTDQNTFDYDMGSSAPMKNCSCKRECTMTAPYWSSVHDFLEATGLDLIFGLNPNSASNANDLVYHTAHRNFSHMYAYSYGNEQTGDEALAARYLKDMTAVRAALSEAYPGGGQGTPPRPLLIGADTGIGPRKGTVPSTIANDTGIAEHLSWVSLFAAKCHSVLDAVSWHTYDYRTSDFGGQDHHALEWPPTNPNISRLYDPEYWDVGGRLADNVSSAVRAAVPAAASAAALPVWLTETNSICHQGTWNVTNAFFNSLWLLDRFGMMAGRGVPLMARQSLIGYNYSLLGNFPAEEIDAAPDFYTTVLFKKLAGTTVLPAAVGGSSGSERLRAHAFCSANGAGKGVGAVTVVLINTNDSRAVVVDLEGVTTPTARRESGAAISTADIYELTAGWDPSDVTSPPVYRATSRKVALNGDVLVVDAQGGLPKMAPRVAHWAAGQPVEVTVKPLSAMIVVFGDARAAACFVSTSGI